MANTYTPNVQLAMPAAGDRTWNVPVNGNAQALDALAPVAALAVVSTEVPSATLNVHVAAGNYLRQDGTIGTYAGVRVSADDILDNQLSLSRPDEFRHPGG